MGLVPPFDTPADWRSSGPSANGRGAVLPEPTFVALDELAELYVRVHQDQQAAAAVGFWQRVEEFARPRGKLLEAYFSSTLPAAVVHIATIPRARHSDEILHVVFPSAAPAWLTDLLFQVHTLYVEVRQSHVLQPDDSRICLDMLFTLFRELLRFANTGALNATPDSGTTGALSGTSSTSGLQRQYTAEVERAREVYERSAQRRAQTTYFFGMVLGIPGLALLSAVIYLSGMSLNLTLMERVLAITTFLVGGLGAIVSVMQRMTSGNLTLRHRAGRLTLSLVGAFRPLVGGIFGVTLYVLLAAGMLPIKAPEKTLPIVTDPFIYFVGALAFIAGFSERFAQDMLATGQSQLSVGSTLTTTSSTTTHGGS